MFKVFLSRKERYSDALTWLFQSLISRWSVEGTRGSLDL
jgi:hypothetical protein